ncbi:MAG: YbaN family protein [Clostridia bacterium]|nr:YbaN family protein [Clostridia bacterium]
MRLKKLCLLILGLIAFVLGTMGVFLPILPTVPLYLLTAFCFAAASERLYRWFLGTTLYKKHLKPYLEAGGLSLKGKILLILFVSLQIGIAAYLARAQLWVLIVLLVLYIGFLLSMIFVVKTVSPSKKQVKLHSKNESDEKG